MASHLRLLPGPGSEGPALGDVQRRLVASALPMVEQCAGEIAARYRGLVTRPELLGPGTIALHQAAAVYDEERHPDFAIFARHHIRGHMLDAIRAERFSLRARVERAMERAFERLSAHATPEVNLFMDDDETVLTSARKGQEEALAASFLAGALEAQGRSVEEEALDIEARTESIEALGEAVGTLYPHEQEVIRLVYEQGMTLDEVARARSVHLNTAKLRHASALRKLRSFFVERDKGSRVWPRRRAEPSS